MSEVDKGAEFLKQRYPGLAVSPEVKKIASRTAARDREPVSKDPHQRISDYLGYLKEVIARPEEEGIGKLKRTLIDRYVVRMEDIPEGYWQSQLRMIRDTGQAGDWEELEDIEIARRRDEHLAQVREDQQGSLEEWIDYLADEKSSYLPDHLKYWIFESMLRLERYEKGRDGEPGRFPERPSGRQRSVKMFPEVNENGLKFIASAYAAQEAEQPIYWGYNQDIPNEVHPRFEEALTKRNFRSAYEWAQEYIPPITDEEMEITEGENCGWTTFSKSLGHTGKDVAQMLRGKGTGWCIAGENIAQEDYLDEGDLHIYFTRDKNGLQTIPRVVIVSQGSSVTEVRGIAWEENVDDYIQGTNVIGAKLQEIPGGDEFFQTDADTRQLTAVERTMRTGGVLTREELAFLYEIDRPIQYFGVKKDPRIAELRDQRNAGEDMSIIFDCEPSQIAHSPSEVIPGTKAYIGPLAKIDIQKNLLPEYRNLFKKLINTEYIYTSFPEGRIKREHVRIGDKTKKQIHEELVQAGIKVSSTAQDLIDNFRFSGFSIARTLDITRLKLRDLGVEGHIRTSQLYKVVKELGLDLCPAEIGPQYRLQYTDQDPEEGGAFIGMEPVLNSRGEQNVFLLTRYHEDSVGLDGAGGEPSYKWSSEREFVFRLPKPRFQALSTARSFLRSSSR